MPTDVAIIVSSIALVFVIFGGTLAACDYYTSNNKQPGARRHMLTARL